VDSWDFVSSDRIASANQYGMMAGSPAGGGMINPSVYPGILQGGPEVRPSLPYCGTKCDREFQFQGLHHMAAAGFGADLSGGYNPNLVRFSLQLSPFLSLSRAFCCGALRFAALLLTRLLLLFSD
jgi:hypothetical protein